MHTRTHEKVLCICQDHLFDKIKSNNKTVTFVRLVQK